MAEVFISYSRKDGNLVRRLSQTLTDNRRGVWVDWEGIPVTADWWREIREGIESADNFLFVTSPNSLESPICQLELAHAIHCNKRIIPIIVADPNESAALGALATRQLDKNTLERLEGRDIMLIARDNWQVISRLNWIDFKDDTKFDGQVKALIDAIGMDLDHVRQHTRLHVRAQEWANNGRAADFLLRGEDLADAQAWRERGKAKEPSPTPRHLEFIQASETLQAELLALEEKRKQENIKAALRAQRAQRLLIAAGIIAGLVAGIAALSFDRAQRASAEAGIAINNAQTATVARGQAERAVSTAQTQLAVVGATLTPFSPTLTKVAERIQDGSNRIESLRLAALANSLLQAKTGNVETAALLAIHALKTAYTAEADAVLVQALARSYTQHMFSTKSGAITSVAFSPDGRYTLSGSADNTAHLWDRQSGKLIQTYSGHSGAVTSVTFSGDGNNVLTGSADNTARLWDRQSGKLIQTFTGHSGAVTSVTFSGDGSNVLTGSADNTARLWDRQSGNSMRTFKAHFEALTSVAFSPDSRFILTGSKDQFVRLWDKEKGDIVRNFVDHTGPIYSVAFSPDGRYILTGSGDQTARLWEVQSGATVHVLSGHLGAVTGVAFSSDGKSLLTASGDKTAIVWDAQRGVAIQVLSGHTAGLTSVVFSPDSRYVLTGSDDQSMRLWDTIYNSVLSVFVGHTSGVNSVAFSPDGRYLATGSADTTVRLWDAQTGAFIRTLTGATGAIISIAFAPDSRYLVGGGADKVARLWDVTTGETIRNFNGHTDVIFNVTFSSDGRYILTASGDQTARLWDANKGDVIRIFQGHSDTVTRVRMSTNGRYVLTGSWDQTARLWDSQTGNLVRTFDGHTDAVFSIAFSPDDRTIVTGSFDQTIRLWNAQTGEVVRTLRGHTGAVGSLVFSPDGRYILSSGDTTARLWDAQTGALVRVFSYHTDSVLGAALSPNGQYVLTGSADKTARLWNTNYQDFISVGCTRIFRDLTNDDLVQFDITLQTPTCLEFGNATVREAAIASTGNTATATPGVYKPTPTLSVVVPAPNFNARKVTPPVGSVRLGEFAVERYCDARGDVPSLSNNSITGWACVKTTGEAYAIDIADFDQLCRARYGGTSAFVMLDQRKDILGYNWSCYDFRSESVQSPTSTVTLSP